MKEPVDSGALVDRVREATSAVADGAAAGSAPSGVIHQPSCRFSRIELAEHFLLRHQLPEVLVAHHQVAILNRSLERIRTARCGSRMRVPSAAKTLPWHGQRNCCR